MFNRFLRFHGLIAVGFAIAMLSPSALGADPPEPVRIKASAPNPFDSFGRAVSISGNVALIGAFWDDEIALDSGSAYIFELVGASWTQAQKVLPSDGTANNWFGYTTAIEGDTSFIGALQHDHTGNSGNGPAYVFRNDSRPREWVEAQELQASDGGFGDGFSFSIGIAGDVGIVGAPNHDQNGTNAGSAYMFRFDGSQWVESQELLASDPTFSDVFGFSVGISSNVLVIGAHGHDAVDPDDLTCDSGAAYVFRFNKQTDLWEEEAKLTASDAACGDSFGWAASISGEAVVVGAYLDDDNGFNSGAAYVFRFDPEKSQWVEEQKLLPSDGQPSDAFGWSLAVEGDLAVIRAAGADDIGASSGVAYVFRRNPAGVWIEQRKLLPQPNAWTQFFGRSIDIDGTRVIAGAHGEDTQEGAAYIFDLSYMLPDLDVDGDVDAFDLALLLGNWGPCADCGDCPADLDGDCDVGAFDLAILLGNWG